MKEVTLCFDFGNTRLKCGIFIGGELQKVEVLDRPDVDSVQKLLDTHNPEFSILSSVIHHDQRIEDLLASRTQFIKLDASTKLPFTTPVARPETIGADRLALCAFATRNFPGKNNLVIALGSCITYNFISCFHSFNGGSISPGMEMRFKSLHNLTAALPLITIDPTQTHWEFPLIGYDTRTNILSGVLLGMAAEIDGIIDAYKEKFNNFNVLLTGGDTANFVQHLKNKIFADPFMIMKGLYAISKFNHDNKK